MIGEVRQVDSFGQQRVGVSFHRLLLPNEQSIMLDQFQGLNQIGETWLATRSDHHCMKCSAQRSQWERYPDSRNRTPATARKLAQQTFTARAFDPVSRNRR